jgi:hypothetical protein
MISHSTEKVEVPRLSRQVTFAATGEFVAAHEAHM